MTSEPVTNVQQPPVEIKANLEVLQGAFRLGAKGSPRKVEVRVGHMVVLSYGYEFADASGLPEVYFAGEVVQRDPQRKGVPCWAVLLKEFPGRVDLQARRVLAAISQSEDDPASLHISFYIRLDDPVLLLRRIGGKWEQEADRASYNKQIQADVENWLRALLEKDIQIWSGDERDVLGRIFSELDEFLRRMGLRVDTTDGSPGTSAVIFTRHYPPALYDLAFQFAQAERLLRHLFQQGANISQTTGLSEEDVHRIIVGSEERAGVALFRALVDAAPGMKEKIAQWLEASGKREAASFIKTLYKKYPEREIKLSEQVLLSAIRNPWLTQGEWLKEISESPATRFQQIERRVRNIPVGS